MAITSESTYFDLVFLQSEKAALPSLVDEDCKIILPVFCYTTDTTDTYRNDFYAPLLTLSDTYNNALMYLEECVDGTWTQIAALTDDTYGTYSTWVARPSWLGYRLDWYTVFNAFGIGVYRFRYEYDNITTATTTTKYSYIFDLKEYNVDIADQTTKVTFKINGGKIGDKDNDKTKVNYGNIVWDNEIRIPDSVFKWVDSQFTKEYTRYKNEAQVWTKNSQVENYLLNLKRLHFEVHKLLRITALQSDEIYISDYNIGNQENNDHKRVIFVGSYEPLINSYTKCMSVELEFQPYYQNLEKKRC